MWCPRSVHDVGASTLGLDVFSVAIVLRALSKNVKGESGCRYNDGRRVTPRIRVSKKYQPTYPQEGQGTLGWEVGGLSEVSTFFIVLKERPVTFLYRLLKFMDREVLVVKK